MEKQAVDAEKSIDKIYASSIFKRSYRSTIYQDDIWPNGLCEIYVELYGKISVRA